MKGFIIFLFLLVTSASFATVAPIKTISLDLQVTNVTDALHMLAKFSHLNLVVSANVIGTVSIHVQHASVLETLNLLLASQGLGKRKLGDSWYVAPLEELRKQQAEELHYQEVRDETRELVTRVVQIHYAKAQDISQLLQNTNYSLLSKRGHIQADTRTNTICLQDLPDNLSKLLVVIKKLDIPIKQVLIEARLASVDSDFERELGINFTVREPVIAKDVVSLPQNTASGHFNLAVAKLPNGSQLDISLAALENQGHGELISSPSLFTANQQTALIESGEEIPCQETSSSGATSVAFKKAVLSLEVTPQIMPGNKVMLQLKVNQDKPNSRIVLGVPAITTRQIVTNILINNGQTIVLGGIYELDKEHVELRIPFLSKIPLVGLLFQQQNAKENKRELLIFVTPMIIS